MNATPYEVHLQVQISTSNFIDILHHADKTVCAASLQQNNGNAGDNFYFKCSDMERDVDKIQRGENSDKSARRKYLSMLTP